MSPSTLPALSRAWTVPSALGACLPGGEGRSGRRGPAVPQRLRGRATPHSFRQRGRGDSGKVPEGPAHPPGQFSKEDRAPPPGRFQRANGYSRGQVPQGRSGRPGRRAPQGGDRRAPRKVPEGGAGGALLEPSAGTALPLSAVLALPCAVGVPGVGVVGLLTLVCLDSWPPTCVWGCFHPAASSPWTFLHSVNPGILETLLTSLLWPARVLQSINLCVPQNQSLASW